MELILSGVVPKSRVTKKHLRSKSTYCFSILAKSFRNQQVDIRNRARSLYYTTHTTLNAEPGRHVPPGGKQSNVWWMKSKFHSWARNKSAGTSQPARDDDGRRKTKKSNIRSSTTHTMYNEKGRRKMKEKRAARTMMLRRRPEHTHTHTRTEKRQRISQPHHRHHCRCNHRYGPPPPQENDNNGIEQTVCYLSVFGHVRIRLASEKIKGNPNPMIRLERRWRSRRWRKEGNVLLSRLSPVASFRLCVINKRRLGHDEILWGGDRRRQFRTFVFG